MTTISIHEDVTTVFPAIRVAAVRVSVGIAVDDKLISSFLEEACDKAASAVAKYENVVDHPAIARWRTAYSKMGVKPSKYRSSIESLIRRAQRGAVPATGVPLVDFYNAVSLTTLMPMGGYDASKIGAASIVLRRAVPTVDEFQPLGSSALDFPLHDKLVVYGWGNQVLCWGFNSRDSELVSLGKASRAAIFFSEATDLDVSPLGALLELRLCAHKLGLMCGEIVSVDAMSGTVDIP